MCLRGNATAQTAIAASSNAVNFQSIRATLSAVGMTAHPRGWMIASRDAHGSQHGRARRYAVGPALAGSGTRATRACNVTVRDALRHLP
jgi:hypothetical protein